MSAIKDRQDEFLAMTQDDVEWFHRNGYDPFTGDVTDGQFPMETGGLPKAGSRVSVERGRIGRWV